MNKCNIPVVVCDLAQLLFNNPMVIFYSIYE